MEINPKILSDFLSLGQAKVEDYYQTPSGGVDESEELAPEEVKAMELLREHLFVMIAMFESDQPVRLCVKSCIVLEMHRVWASARAG